MTATIRFLFVVALLTLSAATFAQDGVPTPNDPAVNPDANACFEGGSMAGRCGVVDSNGNGVVDDFERNFDFECGWFLIRFESGAISRAEFPGRCVSVLPEEAVAPDSCEMPLSNDVFRVDLTIDMPTIVGNVLDNDCGATLPVTPVLPVVDDTNVFSAGLNMGSAGNVEIICAGPGPYRFEAPYQDANGNSAMIVAEGTCSVSTI